MFAEIRIWNGVLPCVGINGASTQSNFKLKTTDIDQNPSWFVVELIKEKAICVHSNEKKLLSFVGLLGETRGCSPLYSFIIYFIILTVRKKCRPLGQR